MTHNTNAGTDYSDLARQTKLIKVSGGLLVITVLRMTSPDGQRLPRGLVWGGRGPVVLKDQQGPPPLQDQQEVHEDG